MLNKTRTNTLQIVHSIIRDRWDPCHNVCINLIPQSGKKVFISYGNIYVVVSFDFDSLVDFSKN